MPGTRAVFVALSTCVACATVGPNAVAPSAASLSSSSTNDGFDDDEPLTNDFRTVTVDMPSPATDGSVVGGPRTEGSLIAGERTEETNGRAPEPAHAPEAAPAPTRSPTTTGATYMAEARSHVGRNYHGDVQSCFQEGFRRDPELEGRIGLSIVLQPNGDIASTRTTTNTTGDRGVGDCVATRARAWDLPPPPPRTLEISFTFSI